MIMYHMVMKKHLVTLVSQQAAKVKGKAKWAKGISTRRSGSQSVKGKPNSSAAPPLGMAGVVRAASSRSLGMPNSIQAQPQSVVAPASDPAIQKVFGRYDKDGSGQMEAKELRSCLRQLNVLVDDAEGDEVRRQPAARRWRAHAARASCWSPQRH